MYCEHFKWLSRKTFMLVTFSADEVVFTYFVAVIKFGLFDSVYVCVCTHTFILIHVLIFMVCVRSKLLLVIADMNFLLVSFHTGIMMIVCVCVCVCVSDSCFW